MRLDIPKMALTYSMCQGKKEEEGLQVLNTWIPRLKDYIEKLGERLFTATRTSTYNMRTKVTEITRNQKSEER